ncbi:MAG: 2-succinyl-5-enolpyruvyl-6-hydroxy-3-cyclohexene-1-carboxylic-acid synthase [bacterium]
MSIDISHNNILWASLIIEELIRNKIHYFCISSGSRSAPLTVAVARNPKATSIIWRDERGAAFHALGYARATGIPAVVICTSGTAGANYLPAIIEASVSNCPLLIISADRPPELRQTGANQTIEQFDIFDGYVRWKFELPCPDETIAPEMVLTTIDQAIYRSRRLPAGPVYINCMFREPLVPIDNPMKPRYSAHLAQWEESQAPFTHYHYPLLTPSEDAIQAVADICNNTKRGIMVIGPLSPQTNREKVFQLIKSLNWAIFTDITSGFRVGHERENFVSYFDQILLTPEGYNSYSPDTVLHIGGQITSKRLLEYLMVQPIKEYIIVKDHPLRHDPLHRATMRIETDIVSFCTLLLPHLTSDKDSHWQNEWVLRSRRIQGIIDDYFNQHQTISEPGVAYHIAKTIPENNGLFLGNSMAIRDMDMYAAISGRPVVVTANRGASGIEGLIATASGFMVGLDAPVTAILGDISFLHDLSSLSQLTSLPQKLIIVILNNHGGGIFSFLPIAQCDDVFEPYFGTPHKFSFGLCAKNFNVHYYQPKTMVSFLEDYKRALNEEQSSIVEINTNRKDNWDLHQALQNTIIQSLAMFSNEKEV